MASGNVWQTIFRSAPPWLRCAALGLLGACLCLGGSSFSVDHAAKMEGDLSGMRMPTWSGGALISVGSNSTASPQILSFDGLGRQLPPFILAIPEAETIDIDDAARGADGTLVVCGSAYDHSGHGSGFLAIVGPGRDSVNVVRLLPYYASRVTVASDGTIWTAGVEVTHGKDSTPPNSGVIRHFDRAGKMLGGFPAQVRFFIAIRGSVWTAAVRSRPDRMVYRTGCRAWVSVLRDPVGWNGPAVPAGRPHPGGAGHGAGAHGRWVDVCGNQREQKRPAAPSLQRCAGPELGCSSPCRVISAGSRSFMGLKGTAWCSTPTFWTALH